MDRLNLKEAYYPSIHSEKNDANELKEPAWSEAEKTWWKKERFSNLETTNRSYYVFKGMLARGKNIEYIV